MDDLGARAAAQCTVLPTNLSVWPGRNEKFCLKNRNLMHLLNPFMNAIQQPRPDLPNGAVPGHPAFIWWAEEFFFLS